MTYRDGTLLIAEGISAEWGGLYNDKEAIRRAKAECVSQCKSGDSVVIVEVRPGESRIVANYKVKRLRNFFQAVFK